MQKTKWTTMKAAVVAAVGALMVLVMGGSAALAADTDSQSERKLQQLYMEYLSKKGYRPEIDRDGDVVFRRSMSALDSGVEKFVQKMRE